MPAGSKPGEYRGGKRKGVPNKMQRARVERAEATGMLPAEVMLNNMRWHFDRAMAEEERKATKDRPRDMALILSARDAAQAAATDSAPYYHNRLSSVEVGTLGRQAQPELPPQRIVHDVSDESIRRVLALVK